MATIKSHTDLEQSRKLAEILPIESADMFLALNGTIPVMSKYIDDGLVTADNTAIPCWSLAALLEVIPNKAQIILAINDFQGDRKEKYAIGSSEHDKYDCYADNPVDTCYEMILKKQKTVGEIVERCKNSWYNEGKIAGQFEGITDDEKYQQGWHDALEKQGNKSVNIDIESMVSSYKQRLKSQGGVENSPLVNMCLTAFRHGIENTLEELNLKELEKQGEQKPNDKIESKFHEGDWVILTAGELSTTLQIVNVDTNKKLYWFNDGSYLPTVDEECLHLWTLKDTKDGDVLACDDKDKVFLYNGKLDLRGRVCAYCGIYKTYDGLRFTKCAIGNYFTYKEPHPATKEQHDLLFAKMKEAGYEWDAKKKKLKKIEPKTLNANKVIEWLKPYGCVVDNIVEQFKKDFKL